MISPATRQRIILAVHGTGHYRAHHDGVLMEIEGVQINGRWSFVLKICEDRKWKSISCPDVFHAVEEFNRWLQYQRYLRTQEAQSELFQER